MYVKGNHIIIKIDYLVYLTNIWLYRFVMYVATESQLHIVFVIDVL